MSERTRQAKLDRMTWLVEELSMRMPAADMSDVPEYELTTTQFRAMTYLQGGPQRMGDIGRHLGVGLSSVTNLVGRLESKGFVRRTHDSTDRRVVTCQLTDSGLRAVTALWDVGRRHFLAIAALLTDEELDHVLRAFEILSAAAPRLDSSSRDE